MTINENQALNCSFQNKTSLPSLDIIIVNWNAGCQLNECIQSIALADKTSFILKRVVIVDNASTDGSIDLLPAVDFSISVIHNKSNKGFSVACNQGARESVSDYLLFLNPDTKLFQDSLDLSMNKFEKVPSDIGIMGIQLVDENKNISRSCAHFPSLLQYTFQICGLNYFLPKLCSGHIMTEWDHKSTRLVDHVIGAFFLLRKDLFEILNGFDERFFVYCEDLDFSFRASQKGFKSLFYAGSQVFHKGGGTSEKVKAKRLFYSLTSRILYGFKHFSLFQAMILTILTLLMEPISRVILAASHLSVKEIKETLTGYKLLWGHLPEIIKTVRRSERN